MNEPSFMARFGAQLVDNDYAVIPIIPGSKVPGRYSQGKWTPYPGWSRHGDRPTTLHEVEIWSTWPDCGIGIATGEVIALDVDVTDATVAHALTELATTLLGETPCLRIGQAPKRLLLYRTGTPFAGRKRPPLEVLAHGQQFVAYAVHPGTGQPYAWPNENPLDVPASAMPLVTEAQVLTWLDQAYATLPEALRPATLATTAMAPAGMWRGSSDPRGTYEAVAAALAHIPNEDLDGHSWITIGNAIKAALGEAGRQLWLDWSRQSGKSGTSGHSATPERRWATLRPHSIGAGTIYELARQRGWVPPPEIILNARAAEQAAEPHPAAALLAKAASLPKPAEQQPYRVPPELLEVDGMLKEFIDYATATAVSPQPFLALGAALCLVGALAGRRYRTPTDLRSNLYAIGIADSGGGKDHARRCVKRLLHASGLERYLGGEDLASSAGLLSSLQIHPCRLFLVDEFGQFLKLVLAPRAPFHKAAIWSELTKLYTSAAEPYIGTEYSDQAKRPRVTIEQPCACLWGVTVPGPFWMALEGGALADGSLARFLVFLTDDDYPERNETPADAEPPPSLIRALKDIAAGVPGHNAGGNLAGIMEASARIIPYTVPLSPSADAAMLALRRSATEQLRAHRGTFATALYGRYAENAAKLAMLAAISRNPAAPTTEARDVTWAGHVVEHCIGTLLREAERRVSDNDTEAKHKRVLGIIRTAGQITRNDLVRKTQFLSRREREEIFDALVEGQLVARTQQPTETKPVTIFTLLMSPDTNANEEQAA